jgi:hypothetical protein
MPWRFGWRDFFLFQVKGPPSLICSLKTKRHPNTRMPWNLQKGRKIDAHHKMASFCGGFQL